MRQSAIQRLLARADEIAKSRPDDMPELTRDELLEMAAASLDAEDMTEQDIKRELRRAANDDTYDQASDVAELSTQLGCVGQEQSSW